MTHPSFRLAAALTCVILFVTAGCGGSPDEATESAGTEPSATEGAASAASADASAAPAASIEKINLNTASEAQFLTIPDVGDHMAHEFDEYRPYVSIQQFRQEIGKYVDEAQVAAYEAHVFVPVNPNDSDEPTLQQLPGVTAAVAAELAAGRPYASNDAFIDALAAHVSAQQAASARGFLASP